MKKLVSQKKIIALISITMLFIAFYVFLNIMKPSTILIKVFHYTINNPDRVNNLFYKQVLLLIVLSAAVTSFSLLYKSLLLKKLTSFLLNVSNNVLKLLTLNTLLVVSLLYLAILFPLAITHYDLGYDEAWCIEYAKNFAHTAIAYIEINEKIVRVDTISMFPFFIASLPNYWLDLIEVWHFKAVSSLLSVLTLVVLFKVSKVHYGKATAVLFLFFLVVQPGFGFVASSYFGELLQAAFLLCGFSICFAEENNLNSTKKLIVSALFFSLAIHTKFQLALILTVMLLALYVSKRHRGILRLLVYVVLFSTGLSILRTLPLLILDFSLIRRLILITDIFAGSPVASLEMILGKIQLFNKFFPLPLFLIISAAFFFYARSLWERALLYFSVITVFWWIFLYPLSTYRNPFMAIITVCLMAAVLVVKAYDHLVINHPRNIRAVKLASVVCLVFIMVLGFYSNLMYAYVGYNDGVQFDIDGYKSRLFDKIEYNKSQKDFYNSVRKTINPGDTVYNGSWVAKFYLENPICTFETLKESLQNSPGEKYLLVARDFYPLGIDKVNSQIDSLGVSKRLILKTEQHELFGVSK